ncbi:transposase [Pseudoroseomonas wenyumeiae]|uniref:Transposase n=1 Tax=Teichococcus wenyumeiae TaxID=2478470 RepID=A0A3A9JFR5_9PROT|nr:transposase [Pseudoroseomonas wenyumeiae]RMI17508.1 transposase [Pseudoroseomonas wenyumeiae]
MWTPAARVQLARGTISYSSCLTDAEWSASAAFMPASGQTGRPRQWPMPLITDAFLYVLRTGCA